MEAKHVKMVWSGRSRQQSQSLVDIDTRRRIVSSTIVIPRPLVRRHSLNGKTIIHTSSHTTDVHNENKHYLSLYRGRQHNDVTKARDTLTRKQAAPMATKITGDHTIKPILKCSREKTVPENLNTTNCSAITNTTQTTASPSTTTTTTSTSTTPSDGTDGKFCYRLPDKPEQKLRKSVSFQDDIFTSAQNFKRLSSANFPRRGIRDTPDAQIFV